MNSLFKSRPATFVVRPDPRRLPRRFFSWLLLVASIALWCGGCGGGGGGGGGSSSSATSQNLTILLRDPTNLPVTGIVTVGGVSQATTNGQVTFDGVPAGTVAVSVLVNGVTTNQNVTVANGGTTTVTITISFGAVPTETPTTPPISPFGTNSGGRGLGP